MPTYLTPGVYVEEIPSGAKPIEGAATSIAAFVGHARRGPAGDANLIGTLDDYKKIYGDIADTDDAMGLAVEAFYLNGGKTAYICRLAGEDAAAASTGLASQDPSETNDVLTVNASSVGAWGNQYFVRLVKPDAATLNFTLEVGTHNGDGEFEAEEIFDDLSMRADAENYALSVVNDNSLLVSLVLGEDDNNNELTYGAAVLTGGELDTSDAAFFQNIDTSAPLTLVIDINGHGYEQITIDVAGVAFTGNFDGDAQLLADEIDRAIDDHSTLPIFESVEVEYASGRFTITSPVDGSSASLALQSTILSDLLALTGVATVLTGDAVATDDDHFSDSFGTTASQDLTITIDGFGPQSITIAPNDLAGTSNAEDGERVARDLQSAVRSARPTQPVFAGFTCTYNDTTRQFILTSGAANGQDSSIEIEPGDLAALLGLQNLAPANTQEGGTIVQGTARVTPAQNLGVGGQGIGLASGADHPPTAGHYSAFYTEILRKRRDVTMILLPGEFMAAGGTGNAVVAATLAHADVMNNRMVFVDPPPNHELPDGQAVRDLSLSTSTYAVSYYPWVEVANPFFDAERNRNAPRTVAVPPSAFAAGLWTKTDGRRGVWKAPAGVESQLAGVSSLQFDVGETEQSQLNPLGINCFRRIPSFGPVIWGSRTLATKANPEWRYVPVRRTANFIKESIFNGIQWAVFEPNGHLLWASLRANIGGFMNGLFRAGAFQGETADQAYFVRCNLGDTMTQGDIDRGQVIVIVGFAPLKPAEFVIVRIMQKINQDL